VRSVSASVAGSASVTASVVRTRTVASAAVGAASVTATVVRVRTLSASAAGAASVDASVVRVRSTDAAVAGSASVTAAVVRSRLLSASVTAGASVTSDVVRVRAFGGSISGSATVSAAVVRVRALDGGCCLLSDRHGFRRSRPRVGNDDHRVGHGHRFRPDRGRTGFSSQKRAWNRHRSPAPQRWEDRRSAARGHLRHGDRQRHPDRDARWLCWSPSESPIIMGGCGRRRHRGARGARGDLTGDAQARRRAYGTRRAAGRMVQRSLCSTGRRR
jgi:hypothetical protein